MSNVANNTIPVTEHSQRVAAPTRVVRPKEQSAAQAPTARAAGTTERTITSAPAATATTPEPSDNRTQRNWITPARVGFLVAAILLYVGYVSPTERFITPESGIGYALGIVGGSGMLLLLLYPARKRFRWLKVIGTVKLWFQAHMVLGIIGPLFVLYHSNFSLGATNSNAALFAMLIVSGSGIVGRYFYTRIHFGLYGRKASRAEMQAEAEALKDKVAGSRFVPDLLQRLDAAEARMLKQKKGLLRQITRPLYVTGMMLAQRWALTRIATNELRTAAETSPVLAKQHAQFAVAVRQYIKRRLQATRQVAEFESYERLFSLWHMLHLPLFFLLLVASIVHVISVHVY